MDIRYTILFLFMFLSGMITHAIYGAELPTANPDDTEMEEEYIVDFIQRMPMNIDQEIKYHNDEADEIVVTFDFDETTMPDKKDNKKGMDLKLIKKSSIKKL